MKKIAPYAFFLSIAIVFLASTAFSTSKTTVSLKAEKPIASEIVTDGLYYAEFYDYIYRGHFEYVELTPQDSEFLMIFSSYLRAFGTLCDQYLPADKVKIMEQVCKTESVTTNGYGMEVDRTCVAYKWVPSGLYAKPDLYSAKMTVENEHRSRGVETVYEMIMDDNAMGNSVDRIHKTKGLQGDMKKIFKLNPGNSDAIKKFEDNLKRFALGQPSVRINTPSKYTIMKKTGGPTTSQNHQKLLNDLVLNQSKTWGFNRYVNGSISNIAARKDSAGRLTSLNAAYQYKGFGGNSRGGVRMTFKNGLPECIYFADFPNNCKTPNSSIVAAFAKGDYTER